jgi:ubiquinone/menaquinone biosynthesis C-methylase UbiE
VTIGSLSKSALERAVQHVGKDWQHAPGYYDAAEHEMDLRWEQLVWPFIHGCNFEICVDLAAGHGRNTRKLLEEPGCIKVYVVDVNIENIAFCQNRFAEERRVTCFTNDGLKLGGIPDGEITMFYCFDAMVHFDSDVVRSYLAEIRRVLDPPRGRAFLHHSNYTAKPCSDVHDNPAWRNFMSAELLQHYACKEGLTVEKQLKLDWTHDQTFTDCFSLLRLAS